MLLTPVYTTDLADHSSSLTAVHLSQRSLSNLHAAPGVPLNTPCMRIIIWDGVLRGHCSFVEFPVLVNVICRVLACVLKTCLHFKNNFLKNNPPLRSPLSQTIHSCPELYIAFPHAFLIMAVVFF